jgi:CubicO group peptidase (beta-lactamase class C family)
MGHLVEPDKFQQAWQAQTSATRVTADAGLLLQEVRRNQRNFSAGIYSRDVREVVVGLVMIPVWFFLGIAGSLPWTWWLTVPALVWMIGFMLVYRKRYVPKPSEPDEPLIGCVKNSLTEVEAQIWLLRNVFWWYLLPPSLSISAFFIQVGLSLRAGGWLLVVGNVVLLELFVAVLYGGVYWLNQHAVRRQLEPRRQELLALLISLGDDAAEEQAALRSAQNAASSRMLRRGGIAVLCLATLVIIALAIWKFQPHRPQPPRVEGPAGAALGRLITDLRKEKDLVGLAAMVTVDGKVEAAAADGERKIDSDVPVQISDRWHLGGISKSITATMIARLVEAGRMHWSDTVGKAFPDAPVHADWKPVTLGQLLTDTAGAPAYFGIDVLRQRPAPGPACTQARRQVVLEGIAEKPAYRPGRKFVYSNVGYTIAAAMAEKATGSTWEDLMKREVFEPLKLTEAGFGPPKSANATLEQPRGHRKVFPGKVAVDDTADNTPIMGPAGNVQMTLANLCTFAGEHLRGELGTGKLLSPATYKRLHTPKFDHQACGWVKNDPSAEIPCTVYWHNGSNTYWYALVAFAPEKKMVVAVVSNDGDLESAEAAAWVVVKKSLAGDLTRPVASP